MFQSRFAVSIPLLVVVLLLLDFPASTTATITIENTGERFPSYPDRLIGGRFVEGHQYMARLQYLPMDIDLCPAYSSKTNMTVIQPRDNLPVVLLARGDVCPDYVKLEVAQQATLPRGLVRFIIIYNSPSGTMPVASSGIQATRRQRRLSEEPQQIQSNQGEEEAAAVAEVFKAVADNKIPKTNIGVLHVSAGTGADLLRLLETKHDEVVYEGGPRVLLDGYANNSTSKFVRSILFWIGLSLMLSGCLCSFLLSMRVQDMLLQEQQQQQTQRPARRRLEMRQVRELLPESVFCQEVDESSTASSGGGEQECSICLDDYVPGVTVLRTLPCGHTYHSQCIAKWLTERSSTCPLCKLDLLPEEEEEEEEEDGEEDVEMQPLETSNEREEEEEGAAQVSSPFVFLNHLMRSLRRRRGVGISTNTTAAPQHIEGVDDEPLLAGEFPAEAPTVEIEELPPTNGS